MYFKGLLKGVELAIFEHLLDPLGHLTTCILHNSNNKIATLFPSENKPS